MHGLEVTALHDKLRAYGPELEGFFEANFQKATKSILAIAQKSFHSLDPKMLGQLNTILQVGAKKVDKAYIQKLLTEQLALELSNELGSSYSSLTNISSSFLFERLVERLQILLDKTISLTKKAAEPAPAVEAAKTTQPLASEATDQLV